VGLEHQFDPDRPGRGIFKLRNGLLGASDKTVILARGIKTLLGFIGLALGQQTGQISNAWVQDSYRGGLATGNSRSFASVAEVVAAAGAGPVVNMSVNCWLICSQSVSVFGMVGLFSLTFPL